MSRRLAALLIILTAALGLVACGGSDAKPLAEVDDIPAGTTYVALDAGS